MRKIAASVAVVAALGISSFAGKGYVVIKGGSLSGDFNGQFRGAVAVEYSGEMDLWTNGAYDLGFELAYSGDSKYFDMGAYIQPGYMATPKMFVGATLGVQGGSLDNDYGIWGGSLGATAKYDLTDEWRIGVEYKHEFDKGEGDMDIDADVFYFTVGYSF